MGFHLVFIGEFPKKKKESKSFYKSPNSWVKLHPFLRHWSTLQCCETLDNYFTSLTHLYFYFSFHVQTLYLNKHFLAFFKKKFAKFLSNFYVRVRNPLISRLTIVIYKFKSKEGWINEWIDEWISTLIDNSNHSCIFGCTAGFSLYPLVQSKDFDTRENASNLRRFSDTLSLISNVFGFFYLFYNLPKCCLFVYSSDWSST